MSHFYATIPQSARRTVASARGHKSTGITTRAASWSGAVTVHLWHDESTGQDRFEVCQDLHHGHGVCETIARGVLGQAAIESEE